MMRINAFIYLIALIIVGCTYRVSHPQFSMSIKTKNANEAVSLRSAILDFSMLKGFDRKKEAGNKEYLESNSMYLLSFESKDKSFITITNLVGNECYDISIYSAVSIENAVYQGTQLRSHLINGKFNPVMMDEHPCKG